MSGRLKLNLGCGEDIREGWVNVDLFEADGVLCYDLNRDVWPWYEGSAQLVLARHIFEHVDDAPGFMEACWRVLEPGGRLDIETPHWKSRDAYTDPTHRRFPTEHTFDYWVEETFLREHHGAAYRRAGISFKYACPVSIISGALHVSLVKTVPS